MRSSAFSIQVPCVNCACGVVMTTGWVDVCVGQDIREVSLPSLRSTIGIIPQETLLFNDTLGYNIGYGDLSQPAERVQEVVERSKLADVVRQLPQGLDSIVGERGMKLSGGEKQRGGHLCASRHKELSLLLR